MIKGGIFDQKFKLVNRISAANYVLITDKGQIKKYNTEQEIMEEFFEIRMRYYDMRKTYLMKSLFRDYEILLNKERFVEKVHQRKLKILGV